MNAPHETSYDEMPYTSMAFPQTHPDHLAVLGKMFGMSPVSPARCRVLELGCAGGGNLLPMAAQYPDASFLGLDLSGRQIAQGQTVVAQLGYRNLELRKCDLMQVDRTYGEFDYIIAHGVYSWIPSEVRDHLMQICKDNLAPNGIAYVSYNVYPGWHMRGMIRDMMLYHASQFKDMPQRVQQARALLDFLGEHVPTENNPYGLLVKGELQELRKQGDWYLAHEHLEGINDPVYFHDFAERAAAKGLQYLAETEFHTMLASNYPPQVGETLRKISGDLIRMEQYMDFLRNRVFRQTLLVHKGIPLNRNLTWNDLKSFYIVSKAEAVAPVTDFRPTAAAQFRGKSGAILNTHSPIVKAAMTILAERAPLGMYFNDLCVAARARLDTHQPPQPEAAAQDPAVLGTDLLRSYAAAIVDLRLDPLLLTRNVSTFPKASDLARFQANNGLPVTNLRHEPVTLDEFNRRLVGLLDGKRDVPALVEALVELVAAGKIVIQQDDQSKDRIVDEGKVRPIMIQAVNVNLQQLPKHALLES